MLLTLCKELWRRERVTLVILGLAGLVMLGSLAGLTVVKPKDPVMMGLERFRESQASGLQMGKLPRQRTFAESWNLPVRVWVGNNKVQDASDLKTLAATDEPAARFRGDNVVYVNAALLKLAQAHTAGVMVAYDAEHRLRMLLHLSVVALMLLCITTVLRSVRQPVSHADASTARRLGALDSLRGVAAFIVFLSHLPIVFLDINWSQTFFVDGVKQAAPGWAEWLKFSPFSILFNGPLMVHVFWVLSGLVLALPHLRHFTTDRLGLGVAKRYFRLMPLAAFSALASVFLLLAGAYSFAAEYRESTGMPVLTLVGAVDREVALAAAWVSALSLGNEFNIPLWTVELELLGSLALFAILAVTVGLKHRLLIWWFLLGGFAFITRQYFMADFMAGLLLADLLVRGSKSEGVSFSKPAAAGLLAGCLLVGTMSPGWLTPWIGPLEKHHESILMMLAASGLVALAAFSPSISRFLTIKPLMWLGERSFGLYVVHALVMHGVGLPAVVFAMRGGMPMFPAIAMGMVLSLLVTLWLADWLTKHVDLPSMILANRIGGWLQGKVAMKADRAEVRA